MNKGTMISNNEAKVRQLENWFNKARDAPFFRTFVLGCAESAPLSWYLAERDRQRLDKAFELPANQEDFNQVVNLLKATP